MLRKFVRINEQTDFLRRKRAIEEVNNPYYTHCYERATNKGCKLRSESERSSDYINCENARFGRNGNKQRTHPGRANGSLRKGAQRKRLGTPAVLGRDYR